MAKNIIKLNIDTNQIDEKIINQALVKGQHNYYEFEFHFYKNGNLYYDENLLFYVVFERADGEKTNKILLLRRGEIYYKKVNEWISDIVGELKISVQILDTQGDVIEAFPLITENVADGLRPSNTTIDEVQYDGILNDINEVNNALEEHKVGTYTQSEIDQKDEAVLQEAKDYADSLEVKIDEITIVKNANDELSVAQDILDDIDDKLDKAPIDNIPLINSSGKIDKKYYDAGSFGYEPDGVTIVLNEDDELEVNLKHIMNGGYL